MGWRAWDAYEREAHERWKALPWRERYNWHAIAALALAAFIGVTVWYVMR